MRHSAPVGNEPDQIPACSGRVGEGAQCGPPWVVTVWTRACMRHMSRLGAQRARRMMQLCLVAPRNNAVGAVQDECNNAA
jgi:hypothetical protein